MHPRSLPQLAYPKAPEWLEILTAYNVSLTPSTVRTDCEAQASQPR